MHILILIIYRGGIGKRDIALPSPLMRISTSYAPDSLPWRVRLRRATLRCHSISRFFRHFFILPRFPIGFSHRNATRVISHFCSAVKISSWLFATFLFQLRPLILFFSLLRFRFSVLGKATKHSNGNLDLALASEQRTAAMRDCGHCADILSVV